MDTAQLIVRLVELVLFGVLAAASLQRWRQRRDRPGLWASATFGVLEFVVVASFLISRNSESDLASWERKVLIAILLLFPYFLFRYASEFARPTNRLRRAAEALTGVVVAWAFLLGKVHGQHAPRTVALDLFVAGVLLQWTLLSGTASRALWRSGRDQATVARKRMRMLALGSAMLNFGLVLGAFAPGDAKSVEPVITGCIAIASGVLFFVGVAPPRVLRVMWRTPDSALLRQAEMSLMSVLDPADIGHALLPHVVRLFGGQGAILVSRDGSVLASYGVPIVEAAATARLAMQGGSEPVVESGFLSVPMRRGWLAVRGSMLTPFFGQDELDVLTGLGVFADLAIERGELFVREREAREAAERANSELETFVYSVSHDLKSPLVSLLGFLDYLKGDLEAGDVLTDETRFFLQRISGAGMYMQALIQDLLELSRIGRVQTEPMPVDVGAVVHEVVDELGPGREQANFEIGPMPVIDMNPLRARQLFTNLMNNALVHSGREDVTISVGARLDESGGVTVTVTDTGKGIPADYRERVFGVFERLDRQDANTAGTGIGLAVCRKIVDQCGGRISIGDNAPGAQFVITFPAATVRRGPSTLEAVR